MVYNYNVFANKTNLRAWRNGRRACLRGMFERVWVQVPPPAPLKLRQPQFFCCGETAKLSFCLMLRIREPTPACGLNATNSKIKLQFYFAFNIAFAPRASDKQVHRPHH